MCVIAYKRKGLSFNLTDLKPMFDANKDGVGFSINRPDGGFAAGKRAIHTWAETLDYLERECPDWGDPTCRSVIHFRIGTSGGKGSNVCHPFPMSADISDIDNPCLMPLSRGVEAVLYHNGIVRGFNAKYLDRYSDTQLLVATLAPHDPPKWRDYLDRLAESNRFLIHWTSGAVEVIGPWHEWQGLRCSNLNFVQRQAWPVYDSGSPWRGAGGRWLNERDCGTITTVSSTRPAEPKDEKPSPFTHSKKNRPKVRPLPPKQLSFEDLEREALDREVKK